MTDYEALKLLGLSPAKAGEVMLDARRGCAVALIWLQAARDGAPRSHKGNAE